MKLHSFAAAIALGLFALGGVANAADKPTIGISMPTKSSARWIADGDNMVKVLQAKGYKHRSAIRRQRHSEPARADREHDHQGRESPGDRGDRRHDALGRAAEGADAGIKVISYDRLIRGSANVDYYATFDNFKVGVLQANSIVHGLGVDAGKTGPFNIELFGGSADDNNAFFFYNGAMSVLQPLIDKGMLVVQSKQMGMDKVATLRWDAATAQARMDNLLSAYYTKAHVNAVLSPYDGLSIGIISVAQGRRLRLQGSADADHLRPGRRNPLGQVDHRSRAVLDDLQGHPRPRQGRRRHGRRRALGGKSRRSTTPRPTTTASRSFRPTC